MHQFHVGSTSYVVRCPFTLIPLRILLPQFVPDFEKDEGAFFLGYPSVRNGVRPSVRPSRIPCLKNHAR